MAISTQQPNCFPHGPDDRRVRLDHSIVHEDREDQWPPKYLVISVLPPRDRDTLRVESPRLCTHNRRHREMDGVESASHGPDRRRHVFLAISRDLHALVGKSCALSRA